MFRAIFHKRQDVHDRPAVDGHEALEDCWVIRLSAKTVPEAEAEIVALMDRESDWPHNGILVGSLGDRVELVEVASSEIADSAQAAAVEAAEARAKAEEVARLEAQAHALGYKIEAELVEIVVEG